MNNNSMIGHNMPEVNLHTALAGLGQALHDDRNATRNKRETMVIVARWLLQLDFNSAGNEDLADSEMKQAGVVTAGDTIASGKERGLARWLARGGVERVSTQTQKNPNEINDLQVGGLNPIEARFLSAGKRFAKVTSYSGLYSAVRSECLTKIRKSLDGKEGAPDLNDLRREYTLRLFRPETFEAWIAEEQAKRSETYERVSDLKKAAALLVEAAKENPEALERGEQALKNELKKIRAEKAKQREEAEAKAAAKLADSRITPEQKRILARGTPDGYVAPEEVSDDEF